MALTLATRLGLALSLGLTTVAASMQVSVFPTSRGTPVLAQKSLTVRDTLMCDGQRAQNLFLPDKNKDLLSLATSMVGQLKTTAALFSGFAFTTLKPEKLDTLGNDPLVTAYLTLDAATLGFELSTVVITQLLFIRLHDGTFGTDTFAGRKSSALGALLAQYGLECKIAYGCFLAGIGCILLSTILRTWTELPADQAIPITMVVIVTIGAVSSIVASQYEHVARKKRIWASGLP